MEVFNLNIKTATENLVVLGIIPYFILKNLFSLCPPLLALLTPPYISTS